MVNSISPSRCTMSELYLMDGGALTRTGSCQRSRSWRMSLTYLVVWKKEML